MQLFPWLACHTFQRASPAISLRRRFFTLPDPFSISPFKGSSGTSEIQTYHEQKILRYKPSQLYEIVADVASYPCFVPFCTGSRILGISEQPRQGSVTVMDAELTVGFLAFQESYVSKVTCKPFESVEAVASSSTPLFRTLATKWHFDCPQPFTDCSATLVTFDLTFAFANPLYATISTAFFTQVSKQMVKAFEDRCEKVYGQ